MRTLSLPHRPSRTRFASLVVAALALAGCAADGSGPQTLSGFLSDPPLSVSGLSLPDVTADGADFTLTPTAGDYLIVYFGYTACPDVCPTTMHEVEVALRTVGNLAERVDVAMVTIDPGRDEPQQFGNYVRDFVADGHALRTDDEAALRRVADAFGAGYTVTTAADGTVEVSHTPNLYLVDDRGDLVLTWPFGLPGDAIAADLEIMLEQP